MTLSARNTLKTFCTITTLTALISLIAFLHCSGTDQTKTARKESALVTFASGGSKLLRGIAKNSLKAGMFLRTGDVITTANGTVDLQLSSGSVIRIGTSSTFSVGKLMNDENRTNQFNISNGSIIARVRKRKSDEEFRIVTPTSIASVRGTTFKVSTFGGKDARVRVYQGRVAMRPRVAGLEKLSAKEIQSDPNLKRLDKIVKNQEVILEANMRGSIDASSEKKAAKISKFLKARGDSENKEKKTNASTAELKSLVNDLSTEKKQVRMETKKLSPQESAEKDSLVVINQKTINQAAALAALGKLTQADLIKLERKVKQEYSKNLDTVVTSIEKKLSQKKLTSNKEIKKYYDILEIVTTKNGKKQFGAIVAQAGDILILHSTKGVKRIKTEEVDFIDYEQK